MALEAERQCRRRGSLLFTHSSRTRFTGRRNSGVRPERKICRTLNNMQSAGFSWYRSNLCLAEKHLLRMSRPARSLRYATVGAMALSSLFRMVPICHHLLTALASTASLRFSPTRLRRSTSCYSPMLAATFLARTSLLARPIRDPYRMMWWQRHLSESGQVTTRPGPNNSFKPNPLRGSA